VKPELAAVLIAAGGPIGPVGALVAYVQKFRVAVLADDVTETPGDAQGRALALFLGHLVDRNAAQQQETTATCDVAGAVAQCRGEFRIRCESGEDLGLVLRGEKEHPAVTRGDVVGPPVGRAVQSTHPRLLFWL
jgi:hypothetical protein